MFKLDNYPVDYILTVHKSNFEYHYGPDSFYKHMTKLLKEPGYAAYDIHNNLILTYGRETVWKYITEYGRSTGGKYA